MNLFIIIFHKAPLRILILMNLNFFALKVSLAKFTKLIISFF
jgi:hypothetical protein